MEMQVFIKTLLDKAKKVGIDPAEAYIAEEDSFSTRSQNDEIGEYAVSSTRGLGFRGMVNGKMGYASTEAFDDEAIEQLIKGVFDSATLCEDTDEQFIYQGGKPAPEMNLYNPAIDEVPPQQKLDFALTMDKKCKEADPRMQNGGDNVVVTSKHSVRIVNSYGVDQQYIENYCGAYAESVVKEGDKTYTGFELSFARDYGKLNAEKIAKEAANKALSQIGADSVPSGSYQAVFTPDTMTSFLGTFCGAFSAESAQKGMSLLAGKVGEKIASDCVTLTDDPLLIDGFSARPFDAEGVPSTKTVVVENGLFKTFLHNLKTAHKDGVETTGNAAKGGYSSAMHVSPTNFYFEPGKLSKDELIKSVGEGLIITSLDGLHSGANGVSGDFSLLAKGFVIKDGKQDRPVEQITVAGNFFQVLKNISGLANDLTFPSGGIGSPTVWVGKLDVAGK